MAENGVTSTQIEIVTPSSSVKDVVTKLNSGAVDRKCNVINGSSYSIIDRWPSNSAKLILRFKECVYKGGEITICFSTMCTRAWSRG